MSRIRTNVITNRMANGAPTVSNGLVISGVTTTSDVNVGQGVTFTQTGNATFTGIVTATSFVGSGANLTSLPAGQLTGTVADARISTLTASKLTGALPAIDGSNLTGISGVTINNNADNRVITGSGSANTLNGESTLVWNGTKLQIEKSVNAYMQPAINVYNSYDGGWGGEIRFSAKYSGNEEVQARLRTWGGSHADDASLSIETGAPSEAIRITPNNCVNINGDFTNTTYNLSVTGGSSQQMKVVGQEADIWMESTGGSSTYWRILGSTGGSTHKFRIYDQTNGGDRLNIDGNGQVTKPAQASFAAYRNADAYSLNGDDFSFNATLHNIGNHFNTSNYRFTAPVAGRYLFTFYSILQTQINNGVYSIRINGGGGYGQYVHFCTFNNNWDHVSTSWILNLSANDYVTMRSDSNIGWHGNSWQRFCGELLS